MRFFTVVSVASQTWLYPDRGNGKRVRHGSSQCEGSYDPVEPMHHNMVACAATG